MTIHYLDETILERHSYVLAFRKVKFKQTHENLAQFIYNWNKEYDLNPEKIRYAVTDGGSYFVKAFEVYGIENIEESSINIENTDIIIIDDEYFTDENIDEDTSGVSENDQIIDNDDRPITMDNVIAEIIQDTIEEEIRLPKHFRCTV